MIDRDELTRLRKTAEAYPFVDDEWKYTNDHGIANIRYSDKRYKYRPVWKNIKYALNEIFPFWKEDWEKQLSGARRWWLPDFSMAWAWLTHVNDNVPDGMVDGSIITFWAEQGEFIAEFPPSKVLELIELAERALQPAPKAGLDPWDVEAIRRYEAEQRQHTEEDRS